mgnify:CR=1 FL=1
MTRITHILTTLSLISVATGCATGIEPEGNDQALDPPLSPEAQLESVWYRSLPEARPVQAESVLGGNVRIGARFKGEDWTLSFGAGQLESPEGSQAIASSVTNASTSQEIEVDWSTHDFGETAQAGSRPDMDDTFTLLLTARTGESDNGSMYEARDALQVQLDNTPPIALISRICLDREGEQCFGFTPNPSDFGTENATDSLLTISQAHTTQLYVHGIALDKTFQGYTLSIIGGQASMELPVCTVALDHSICLDGTDASRGAFGYGTARDLQFQETLAQSSTVDGYSDDVLLMVWDISYLSPDAYGLSLTVFSNSYIDGNDDPALTRTWVTFLIEA